MLLYAGLSSLFVLSQSKLGPYEPQVYRDSLEHTGMGSQGTICLNTVEDQNQGWRINFTVHFAQFLKYVNIVI